jgi:hypothetical protein
MREANFFNNKDNQVLMYGDRVLFTDTVAGDLQKMEFEGLYAGPCADNPRLSVVTVVSPVHYRGEVLYPRTEDLKRIEHEPAMQEDRSNPIPSRPEKEELYDKTTLMEMRDNILDNFDFDKVHKAMVALDWGWGSLGDDRRVPEVSELKREARRLLTDIIDTHIETGNKWVGISTGGFDTELLVCDDGLPDLSLRFYVDEWSEGGEVWDEYRDSFERRRSNGVSDARVSSVATANGRKSRFFNND